MDTPNILDFDIYHAGISGGKDSTDLALWLRFESGLPLEKIDLNLCDTGNEDLFTYGFLDILRAVVAPLQIRVIKPPLDFWELAHHKGRFPSTKSRFCTIDLKVIPSRADVLRLMQEGKRVLVMNGIRKTEGHNSNTRGTALEWELDWDGWGTWIHRPILHHTIDDVWDMHRKYIPLDAVLSLVWNDPDMADEMKTHLATKIAERGVPCNPLYVMGASRVGCFPCINARKNEVRAMDKYRPQRIDFIEQEELTGFTHTRAGISTFFRRNMTPERWRSREVTTTKGEVVTVPTIRDVTEWAKTARGGKQYDMDFDVPLASACDIGGMCE
jgi:3'-phosphoadenosine 5'-phosphosulfate sulfotransferase (PAPS reductase)/FAD synthetase